MTTPNNSKPAAGKPKRGKRKRTLKVYGWRDFRRECPPAPNGSRQTREIMAAHSKAEVKRMFPGVPMSEITETGNTQELETALAKPGVNFWRSLDAPYGSPYIESKAILQRLGLGEGAKTK